jgi:hypothetical protein
MRVGDRFALRPEGDVVLGRTPQCDIVMTSPGQGGRRNSGIRASGNGFALQHDGHSLPIFVNGKKMNRHARDLVHGDVIEPGRGLRFRYVVEGGDELPTIGTNLRVLEGLLLFDRDEEEPASWRCVPLDRPDDPPRRAFFADVDSAREGRLRLAGRIGPPGPAVHQVLREIDGGRDGVGVVERPNAALVVTDDVAGASAEDLVTATHDQRAELDPAIAAVLVRSILDVIAAARVPLWVSLGVVHVRFSGEVLCDAAVAAALLDLEDDDLGRALAHVCASLGVFDIGARDVLGRAAQGGVPATVVVQALRAWIERQAPVTSSTLAGLVANLFPERVERDRALRERIALLDEDALRALGVWEE